jgi:carbamoyltransferase
MKRYVGFSEYYHDAALAIVNEDGTVAFASQSERYSGKKNDSLIPPHMWTFVNEDDHVTFYEDWRLRAETIGGPRTHGAPFGDNVGRNKAVEQRSPMHNSLTYDDYNTHHESHCALAFFTRPWESKEDTVMVSVDGSGESESVAIYDHNFNVIKKILSPQSLGLLYSVCVVALGFQQLRDEYIVMGLAPYGQVDDKLYGLLKNCYYWYESNDGKRQRTIVEFEGVSVDGSELMHKFAGYESRIYARIKLLRQEDGAATVQKFFEDEVLKIMKIARQYGSKLVYGGGCAQNVSANTKIRELFDDMHVAIAPSDAGNALGCAAYTWHKQTGGTHLDWSPYLGHNIEREINPKEVAKWLVANQVCGIANGRAEYGPRALGNRSLIADVRYDIKDTVNGIKRRHKFRPFGPSILSEYADEYFDGPMNEYMQYVAKAKHDYSSVTHVDGTARVQLVKPDCKSVFRQVLEEYYELTGVPMLLNTSLNIRNKPMVNTIEDAAEWQQKYKVRVF